MKDATADFSNDFMQAALVVTMPLGEHPRRYSDRLAISTSDSFLNATVASGTTRDSQERLVLAVLLGNRNGNPARGSRLPRESRRRFVWKFRAIAGGTKDSRFSRSRVQLRFQRGIGDLFASLWRKLPDDHVSSIARPELTSRGVASFR